MDRFDARRPEIGRAIRHQGEIDCFLNFVRLTKSDDDYLSNGVAAHQF